jgi:hypothetical protein
MVTETIPLHPAEISDRDRLWYLCENRHGCLWERFNLFSESTTRRLKRRRGNWITNELRWSHYHAEQSYEDALKKKHNNNKSKIKWKLKKNAWSWKLFHYIPLKFQTAIVCDTWTWVLCENIINMFVCERDLVCSVRIPLGAWQEEEVEVPKLR